MCVWGRKGGLERTATECLPALSHSPAKALTLYPLQLPHNCHLTFLHAHSHFPPRCSAGNTARQVPAPRRLTPGSFLSYCRVQQESGAGIPTRWASTCRSSPDNSEPDPWATFLSDTLCLGGKELNTSMLHGRKHEALKEPRKRRDWSGLRDEGRGPWADVEAQCVLWHVASPRGMQG